MAQVFLQDAFETSTTALILAGPYINAKSPAGGCWRLNSCRAAGARPTKTG